MRYGQTVAVKKIVKRELDKEVENKVAFSNSSAQSITDTGSAFSLTSGISQGTTALTRIGDAIKLKRITTRFEFQNNDAFARIIRVVGIISYAPEITWTSSLLFFYNGTTGYETSSPINWPEMSGRGRVFCDKRIVCSPQPEQGYNKVWQYSRKFNHKVTYDRAGNTGRGHIVWFLVSDDATTGMTCRLMSYTSYQDA